MKTNATFLSITAIGAVLIAFFVGFETGKSKMDDFCGLTIQGSSAGAHSESFSKHIEAINALKSGEPIEAERLLRLLARVDAQLITQCNSNPQCRSLMMTSVPNQTLVRDALTWK